jgi:2,3-bisphosphoglycerate-dependent phosphoglycerate mutase
LDKQGGWRSTDEIPDRLNFTFLRHGESEGNQLGVIQGQSDYELTEPGIQQAQKIAQDWQTMGIQFDQIISSPLSRAHDTAKVIAKRLNNDLIVQPEWMERDFGSLSGISGDEVWSHPEMRGFFHPYDPVGDSGESQWDLYLRASEGVQKLLDKPFGRYLIVSHGGILNMTLRAIMGISPQRNQIPPRFYIHNTAFTRISMNPDKYRWDFLSINEVAHSQTVNE